MRTALIGLVGVTMLTAAPVLAADMPTKAPPLSATPSWTGFYAGIELGGGWFGSGDSWTPNDPASAQFFSPVPVGFPGQQPMVSSYRANRKGAAGGLEGGYNWQADKWVWGVEADLSLSGIRGSGGGTSILDIPLPATQTTISQQSIDWYGTVRGRLGWLVTPNILLFGTGGFAYGRAAQSANYLVPGPPGYSFGADVGPFGLNCTTNVTCVSGSSATTKTGWTVGGGIEWMFDKHWNAKLEYQLVDLGSTTMRVTALSADPGLIPASFNVTFRDEINILRMGLNYRW